MVVPLREITTTLATNQSAKLNPDGSYLYQNGTAVKPTVIVKHIPTGKQFSEDGYNTSGGISDYYTYYTTYTSNVTSKPQSPAVVEANVDAKSNGLRANQSYPQIVTNKIGSAPGSAGGESSESCQLRSRPCRKARGRPSSAGQTRADARGAPGCRGGIATACGGP